MAARRKTAARGAATDWFAAVEGRAPAPPAERAPDSLDAWNARWAGFNAGVPIAITAHLGGRVALPNGPMALDALLAAAVCMREGVEPAMHVEHLRPVEIPVVRAPGGRFHLASFSVGAFENFETKFVNRRFPIDMAQAMGAPDFRRILISGGPCKSYRIPLEVGHVEDDKLRWFALGDIEAVRELLSVIHYLGKRRGVGLGRVLRWEVEPIEPWGEGFPVVSPEGRALRTLPLDWPGLVDPVIGHRVISFPYWRREAEEPAAMATAS